MIKTLPTSFRTHSSKTPMRKSPQDSGTSDLPLSLAAVQRRRRCKPQTLRDTLPIRHPLDNGGELDELYPLILEEAVYIKGITCCLPGNTGQNIIFYTVFLQKFEPVHNLYKTTRSFPIVAIPVVYLLGAVKADPHYEIMFFQKGTPLISQQGAVGLESVRYGLCPCKMLL